MTNSIESLREMQRQCKAAEEKLVKAVNKELRKRLETSRQARDDLEELEEYMSEESKDESVCEDKQKSTNSDYILLLGVGYLSFCTMYGHIPFIDDIVRCIFPYV